MEEQILKIIRDHFYNVNGTPEKSAKEITSHVMEFIEWLKDFCHIEIDDFVFYWVVEVETHVIEAMDTETAYQYWLTNIKTK